MNESSQLRNSATVGGPSQQHPLRKMQLEIRLFANTDQGVPVRVVHGRDKLAGVNIFPIFNFRSEQAPVQGGGK